MNPFLMFILVLAAIPLSYGALSLLSLTVGGVWTFFASIGTSPGCFLVATVVLSAAITVCAIHVWLKLDAPEYMSEWASNLDAALGDRLEYAAAALAAGLTVLEGFMFVASPAAPTTPSLALFATFGGLGVGAVAVIRLLFDVVETIGTEFSYRRYLARKEKQ
ncbi:hypothetical protein WL29_22585 [Burkholderia ubonensis]|uniref:Uncharacterized protein n=1 Tax=Burkholderia ubonensis TaxID=101571 RepID=A0A106QDA4_9BURK|nr:hypothetical protein [Burkholderia ubonensis]KWA84153.1 hypothetical protein WL29_22585 [Burkholderia ubonensis]